jgi:hypothetical protein
MPQTPQALLISPRSEPEIYVFLQDYLIQVGEVQMLFALSFESEGMYIVVDALATDGSKRVRKIRLPAQIVLASADATDQQQAVFGFAP